MKNFGLLVIVLAIACMSAGNPPPSVDYEKDLKLTVTFEAKGGNPAEGFVHFWLTNTSDSLKYMIVLPGDGSESAWREPYFYYTVDVKDKKEGWKPVQGHGILRCGLYDYEWEKDTVRFSPRQKMEIYQDWMPFENRFDIKTKGDLRFVAHYEYGAGKHHQRSNFAKDSVLNIPAFTLVSDTVYIKR